MKQVIFLIVGLMTTLMVISMSASPAAAEVSVRAQVDRTSSAPGESLQLQVIISNGEGEVDTGVIKDFKVLSRGTSSSLQIINNRTSRKVAHNYLLIALRQGKLTIPALPVTVDGQSLHTEPIHITVSAQPEPDNGNRGRDVWVTAEVSDSRPYAGQQIAYTFSLYNAVQVAEARFQPPEFEGFTAKELEKRSTSRSIINGREHVITQIHYVLVPLASGTRTIAPAVLQAGIVRPDRRRRTPFDGFFNDPFLDRGSITPKILQSQSIELQVQPLPPQQGDKSFSGLIGRFELSAALETTRLKVGDSTTLAVTIQGQGNIMDAQSPALEVPRAFKTYDDSPQEEIVLRPSGYAGTKIYRTALVPITSGEFQLPPVRLTYFDVPDKTYRTLTTKIPHLIVQPGEVAQATPVTITPEPLTPHKKKVAFTGRDILPPKEGLDALQPYRPISLLVFLIWIAVPAIAFGATTFVLHRRQQDPGPSVAMKAKARQALKAAQAAAADADPRDFLAHLYRALTAAIFSSAGRSGEALTWKEAEAALLDSGLHGDTARQASDLLAAIESSQFSAATLSSDQRSNLLDRTAKMIRKVVP